MYRGAVKVDVPINSNNIILWLICDPFCVKMQYGFNKQSQIFNYLSESEGRFTQFVIKTEQLVFLQRDITLVLLKLDFMQLAMNYHPRTRIYI